MLISVIVTVGNDASHLSEALNSIKTQSLKTLEAIIVPFDPAADLSPAAAMCKADRRFTLSSSVQPSLASARNLGISLAKGDYIIFLDSNNLFTKHYLEEMHNCALKHNTDMIVGRMCGFDKFGDHPFSSTIDIARSKLVNWHDTALIWNPSVTNKLFRRETVLSRSLSFGDYGPAQDAAFSLAFALGCDEIGSCRRSYAKHRYHPFNRREIESLDALYNYRSAYSGILECAKKSFASAIAKAETEFDKKGLRELEEHYENELLLKEITVLLYMFYRRFWLLEESEIDIVAANIEQLRDRLTSSGKKTLLKHDRDLFYKDSLIRTKREMLAEPLLTVAISGELTRQQLCEQLDMLYTQEMASFECLLWEKYRDMVPPEYLNMPNLSFIGGDEEGDFKTYALSKNHSKYIVFLDYYVILDTKILRRHYHNLETLETRGFSASPISQYDGSGPSTPYKLSELAFYVKKDARRTVQDDAYVLDLFFCNKMFRCDHLRGIKFAFTGNSVMDVYRIYNRSSFSKLLQKGVYLDKSEPFLRDYLMAQEKILPSSCRSYYKGYKKIYHRKVTHLRRQKKRRDVYEGFKTHFFTKNEEFKIRQYSRRKLKKQVLFYASGEKNMPATNLERVYKSIPGKKLWIDAKDVKSLSSRRTLFRWLLCSRVIVTDGSIPYLRKIKLRDSQQMVQLWHSCGALKRFGLDAPLGDTTRIDEWRTHWQYTLVSVSSEHVRQFYSHAFGIDLSVVQPLGTPQTDVLSSEKNRAELRRSIVAKHPCLRNAKVYLYCPTFREKGGEIVKYNPQINWARLDDELADNELFIINTHPLMTESYLGGRFFDKVKDYSFEPTPELMSVADVVITDYSSVVLDGALMSLPMVFYCPDFKEYKRDFYVEYPNDLPGPLIFSPEDLLPTVRETLLHPQTEKIESFRTAQVGACDGNSTQRIVKLITSALE